MCVQLGIYDRMKNELIDQSSVDSGNALLDVLNQSAELTLLTFNREPFTPTSYVSMLDNMHVQLTRKQENVFAALYDWRDAVARAEDESVHYVMPKRAMLSLCTHMPVNMDQLTVCLCALVPTCVWLPWPVRSKRTAVTDDRVRLPLCAACVSPHPTPGPCARPNRAGDHCSRQGEAISAA